MADFTNFFPPNEAGIGPLTVILLNVMLGSKPPLPPPDAPPDGKKFVKPAIRMYVFVRHKNHRSQFQLHFV